MPTQSDICHMLTELRDLLSDCGIQTIRGNLAHRYTTHLVLIDAYAKDAKEIIEEGEHPAKIISLGEGVSVIKPVY